MALTFETVALMSMKGVFFSTAEENLPASALKSLVMIRMNEIFPCLACCSQKLNFLV